MPPKGLYGQTHFRTLPLQVSQWTLAYSREVHQERNLFNSQFPDQRIILCGCTRNIITYQEPDAPLMKNAICNSLMQHGPSWCWGRTKFWENLQVCVPIKKFTPPMRCENKVAQTTLLSQPLALNLFFEQFPPQYQNLRSNVLMKVFCPYNRNRGSGRNPLDLSVYPTEPHNALISTSKSFAPQEQKLVSLSASEN